MNINGFSGKDAARMLRDIVTKKNGWYDTEDFNLLVKHEQTRNQRQNRPASYVFIDLSQHYRRQGLVYDSRYYQFLVQLLTLIDSNTRSVDYKNISDDYQLAILLLDTPTDQAKLFVEKLTRKIYEHFRLRMNPEYMALVQSLVFSSFSLNFIDEAQQFHQDPELLDELRMKDVTLRPHQSRSFDDAEDAVFCPADNEPESDDFQPVSEEVPQTMALVANGATAYGFSGGKQINGYGIDSGMNVTYGNGAGKLPKGRASSSNGNGFHVVNGTGFPAAAAEESRDKVSTGKAESKGILSEKNNFYFNWNIFALATAPVKQRAPKMVEASERRQHFFYFFSKRLIDFLGALAGLLFLLPLFAVIAAAIKLTSSGPVFFKQKRVGFRGKLFTFLKFRSMRCDSDDNIHREYVQKLIQGQNEQINNGTDDDPVYKIKDDPRITKVGGFLRKTSLDELPQLFNVLLGHMSLVGPRPPIPYEVDVYEKWHLRRVVEAKPGVTGLWQVYGRNQTTFDDMVRLDLHYIKQRSLAFDLKLIFLTIGKMFNPKAGM